MEITGDVERRLRHEAKSVLRKRARALRNSLPREAILARSQKIVERLVALDAVASASAVALFFPIEARNEVDLTGLDAILRGKARVYYPAIEAVEDDAERTEPPRMTFRRVDELGAMVERGRGFLDPGPEAEEATRLDVIIVPALQIDARGHRIGYGAGYYDRTLPRFAPPALTIGVAFDFQLVPEIPDTEGDVAIGLIVTDERTIEPVP